MEGEDSSSSTADSLWAISMPNFILRSALDPGLDQMKNKETIGPELDPQEKASSRGGFYFPSMNTMTSRSSDQMNIRQAMENLVQVHNYLNDSKELKSEQVVDDQASLSSGAPAASPVVSSKQFRKTTFSVTIYDEDGVEKTIYLGAPVYPAPPKVEPVDSKHSVDVVKQESSLSLVSSNPVVTENNMCSSIQNPNKVHSMTTRNRGKKVHPTFRFGDFVTVARKPVQMPPTVKNRESTQAPSKMLGLPITLNKDVTSEAVGPHRQQAVDLEEISFRKALHGILHKKRELYFQKEREKRILNFNRPPPPPSRESTEKRETESEMENTNPDTQLESSDLSLETASEEEFAKRMQKYIRRPIGRPNKGYKRAMAKWEKKPKASKPISIKAYFKDHPTCTYDSNAAFQKRLKLMARSSGEVKQASSRTKTQQKLASEQTEAQSASTKIANTKKRVRTKPNKKTRKNLKRGSSTSKKNSSCTPESEVCVSESENNKESYPSPAPKKRKKNPDSGSAKQVFNSDGELLSSSSGEEELSDCDNEYIRRILEDYPSLQTALSDFPSSTLENELFGSDSEDGSKSSEDEANANPMEKTCGSRLSSSSSSSDELSDCDSEYVRTILRKYVCANSPLSDLEESEDEDLDPFEESGANAYKQKDYGKSGSSPEVPVTNPASDFKFLKPTGLPTKKKIPHQSSSPKEIRKSLPDRGDNILKTKDSLGCTERESGQFRNTRSSGQQQQCQSMNNNSQLTLPVAKEVDNFEFLKPAAPPSKTRPKILKTVPEKTSNTLPDLGNDVQEILKYTICSDDVLSDFEDSDEEEEDPLPSATKDASAPNAGVAKPNSHPNLTSSTELKTMLNESICDNDDPLSDIDSSDAEDETEKVTDVIKAKLQDPSPVTPRESSERECNRALPLDIMNIFSENSEFSNSPEIPHSSSCAKIQEDKNGCTYKQEASAPVISNNLNEKSACAPNKVIPIKESTSVDSVQYEASIRFFHMANSVQDLEQPIESESSSYNRVEFAIKIPESAIENVVQAPDILLDKTAGIRDKPTDYSVVPAAAELAAEDPLQLPVQETSITASPKRAQAGQSAETSSSEVRTEAEPSFLNVDELPRTNAFKSVETKEHGRDTCKSVPIPEPKSPESQPVYTPYSDDNCSNTSSPYPDITIARITEPFGDQGSDSSPSNSVDSPPVESPVGPSDDLPSIMDFFDMMNYEPLTETGFGFENFSENAYPVLDLTELLTNSGLEDTARGYIPTQTEPVTGTLPSLRNLEQIHNSAETRNTVAKLSDGTQGVLKPVRSHEMSQTRSNLEDVNSRSTTDNQVALVSAQENYLSKPDPPVRDFVFTLRKKILEMKKRSGYQLMETPATSIPGYSPKTKSSFEKSGLDNEFDKCTQRSVDTLHSITGLERSRIEEILEKYDPRIGGHPNDIELQPDIKPNREAALLPGYVPLEMCRPQISKSLSLLKHYTSLAKSSAGSKQPISTSGSNSPRTSENTKHLFINHSFRGSRREVKSEKLELRRKSFRKDSNLARAGDLIFKLTFYTTHNSDLELLTGDNWNIVNPKTKKAKAAFSMETFGRVTLSNIRKRFICLHDNISTVESSYPEKKPIPKRNLAWNQNRRWAMRVGDTLYCDFTDEASVEGCQRSIEALAKQRNHVESYPTQIKDAKKTCLTDLDIRFGFPYIYVHQDGCEHVVVFNQAWVFPNTQPEEFPQSYPNYTAIARPRKIKCTLDKRIAQFVITECDFLEKQPSFLCTKCARTLLFVNCEDDKKFVPYKVDPKVKIHQFNQLLAHPFYNYLCKKKLPKTVKQKLKQMLKLQKKKTIKKEEGDVDNQTIVKPSSGVRKNLKRIKPTIKKRRGRKPKPITLSPSQQPRKKRKRHYQPNHVLNLKSTPQWVKANHRHEMMQKWRTENLAAKRRNSKIESFDEIVCFTEQQLPSSTGLKGS